MDWHIAVLLLAIAVTYLAWRRVRRANELDRARAATLEEGRWTYRLEPDSNARGRGYVVKSADQVLDRDALSWDAHGIEVVVIDGSRADAGALPDEAFDPGSGIRLRSGGGAGNGTVEVWDDHGSLRLGVLADSAGARVRSLLESGELSDCIVLWETRRDDVRTALHLLIVHGEAAVEA